MASQPSSALERFCPFCGEPLAGDAQECGRCGRRWQPTRHQETLSALLATLAEAQTWRVEGLISAEAYRAIEGQIRDRIARVRPAIALPLSPPPSSSEVAAPPAHNVDLGEWASERQADILLYVGAFFLVVAAILFVGYQGKAFSPAVRVAVLAIYTAGFIVTGLLIRRWERVREAGRVFIALGALLAPLNFALLYAELLRDQQVSAETIWFFGSVACTSLYGALFFTGHGRLYRIPAGIALVNAWEAAFAMSDADAQWAPAWNMAGAVLLVSLSGAIRRATNAILGVALTTAALALLFAHVAAASSRHPEAQLPVTYALLTMLLSAIGVGRRAPQLLPFTAASAAAMVIAYLWFVGVAPEWRWYVVLLLGALTVAASGQLARRAPSLAPWAWPYAAICALSPLLGVQHFVGSWHGAATHVLGGAILASIAWRDTQHGFLITTSGEAEGTDPPVTSLPGTPTPTSLRERVGFVWCAWLMLLVAVACAQQRLEIGRPDTAWAFVALATLCVPLLAWTARREPRTTVIVLVPFFAALTASMQSVDRFAGHDTVLLSIAAIELAACAAWARNWQLAALAAVAAAAAAACWWHLQEWPRWSLAAAFEALSLVLLAALSRWRTYGARTDAEAFRSMGVNALSWGYTVLAFVVAAAALTDAADSIRFAARGARRIGVVHTPEYRALVGLVFATATGVAYEGIRVRAAGVLLAASAVAMFAVLLTIAITEPENVQWYSAPTAGYLFGVGLVATRRSGALSPHLRGHELALIAGALVLVVPQAQQGFERGGERWGFVLLLEGVSMLAVGLVLYERWLAVAAVMTLSGVGIRWLAQSGDTIPYWLTLGVGGLFLLGFGVLILLARDRWDRARGALRRWWRGRVDDGVAIAP